MTKSINQPLWERRRFGAGKRNYLKEGMIQYGYWDKADEDVKKLIESINKI